MDSTLLAGIIGAGGATIGVIIAKDSKVSEFRQQWIDALRDDISLLCSLVTPISIDQRISSEGDTVRLPISIAEFKRLIHRVRLRLDLKKSEAVALNDKLSELMNLVGNPGAKIPALNMKSKEVETATAVVLEIAWRRVKRGEIRFQIVYWSGLAALIIGGVISLYKWRHPSPDNTVNCITLQQPLHVQQGPQPQQPMPQLRAPLPQPPLADKKP